MSQSWFDWHPVTNFEDFYSSMKYMWSNRVFYGDVTHNAVDADEGLTAEQKCKKYGYTLVKHEVETEDGYLLNMY